MTPGLRRILLTALLIGLGLLVTLLGRRQRKPIAAVVQPIPVPGPPPASRSGNGMRAALAAGLAGLLLLAGALFTSREVLFAPGPPAADRDRMPLAALSHLDPGRRDAPAREPEPPVVPPHPDRRVATDSNGTVPNRARDGDAADLPPRADQLQSSDTPVADLGAIISNAPSKADDSEAVADGQPLIAGPVTTAGADMRLVLNGPLIAPVTIGPDGTPTFALTRGARPAAASIAAEAVLPSADKVGVRPEGQSSASHAVDNAVERSARRPVSSDERASDPEQPLSTGSLARNAMSGSNPRSPEARLAAGETVLIAPGDTLWTISRRTYGGGSRYTAIHEANRGLVRDPNLIYPGQILVLPNPQSLRAEKGD